MNIKGLISNISPLDVKSVQRTERLIKSDETHDRDANGQQAFDGQNQEHREPMSDEQLAKAIEHLKNLPSTKEHRWQIKLETTAEGRFVLIKDNLGNLIRKIPELELWNLPTDQGSKGQLLKKSA